VVTLACNLFRLSTSSNRFVCKGFLFATFALRFYLFNFRFFQSSVMTFAMSTAALAASMGLPSSSISKNPNVIQNSNSKTKEPKQTVDNKEL
jgi:hypothetical protein